MSCPTRRALGASLALLAAPALAQTGFPSRTVTIVVSFAAGGGTDILTRLLAERMSQGLGRPVVVENRPGGNTIVGTEAVARAQADGYTLLMAAGTNLTVNPIIHRKLVYKLEDFAPITLISTFPFAVIARHDGPQDIAAMIAQAKARPGRMTYGTNGSTTLTNVAMLMVLERLGLTMQDVTYRGDAAQLNDFLAGNLDLMVVTGSIVMSVFRNNQGRLLGWTSAQRVPATPDVPTFAETAPGIEASSWYGLVAPAGTPPAVIEILNRAALQALQEPRIRERLTEDGQFLIGSTPAELGQFMADQIEKWRPILSRMEVLPN